MNQEEQERKMQKIIAEAWMDEGFKQRLLSRPAATLKEQGVEIRPGVEVRIVEDTDSVIHVVLPAKPSSNQLSDVQLAQVAGGGLVVEDHTQRLFDVAARINAAGTIMRLK